MTLGFLGMLGTIMSTVGTGLGIVGQLGAASAASSQAKMQAAQANLQAQTSQTQAAVEDQRRQEKLSQVLSTQRAIFGSSGAMLGSGSFTALSTADLNTAMRDRQQGLLLANSQSSLHSLQADQYLVAGRQQSRAYMLNAGTSLLNFGMDMIDKFQTAKPSKIGVV